MGSGFTQRYAYWAQSVTSRAENLSQRGVCVMIPIAMAPPVTLMGGYFGLGLSTQAIYQQAYARAVTALESPWPPKRLLPSDN